VQQGVHFVYFVVQFQLLKNIERKVTRQKVTGLGYMQLDYIALEVLTEGLNIYQKASTYDKRSQLIIITDSVVLLAFIVSIECYSLPI
jgi:hypothetical protein